MFQLRIGTRRRAFIGAVVVMALAACGGGGGGSSSVPPPGGTPTPGPTGTPLPPSASGVLNVSTNGSTSGSFGPVLGGYSGTVTVPAASTTATLNVLFQTTQPNGTPTVQSLKRRPSNIGGQGLASIAFINVTSNVAVTFTTTPAFTITVPYSASQVGPYSYVALYDPTNASAGWTTIEGPGTASGNTLSFTGTAQTIPLKANTTYSLVIFTVTGALPTPTPTPVAGGCIPQQAIALTLGTPGGGHGGGGTGLSTYALSSNPSGICVLRVDPTANATVTLTTAVNDTPPTASHQWQYQFAPLASSGLGAYAVTIDQVMDGARAVFYNQAADSKGTVNAGTLQSTTRRAASVQRPTGIVTRPFAHGYQLGVDPGHLAVRYRATVLQSMGRTPSAVERSLNSVGHALPTLSSDPLRAVTVPAGVSAETFATQLSSLPEVAAVSAVHRRIPLSTTPVQVNDPHATPPDQWYLFAGGFPNAWAYANGSNAKIAIVDTGIDQNNADLASQLVRAEKINAGNGTVVSTTNAQDTNGHGTNVAGIAGALANNGVGFAGAGYSVKLMAYDIFPDATAQSDQQTANTVDEAQAIMDAVANNADVISLSLGSGEGAGASNGYDTTEHDAIEYAIAHGVVVVAAAGNNADGGQGLPANTNLDYPAAYDGVIAVGASMLSTTSADTYATSTEAVTPYSQYGPNLAVVAPGGNPAGTTDADQLHWIWNYSTTTAAYQPDQCHNPIPATSCTAYFAGTSQATPQVSAAAALLISYARAHGSTLTPAQVTRLIESTADNINDPHQGHGRLNAYRALAALAADPGATYSGPQPTLHSVTQAIAFAYANSGSNTPTILDYNFPSGVPIASDGTFRIADVRPQDASSYRVGVWYDTNGDGIIDAGDYIGISSATCTPSAPCSIGTITLSLVGSGPYALP